MSDEIYVWKFIIPLDHWVDDPSHPGLQWSGCVAACTAHTEAEARIVIEEYAAGNGLDSRWVRLAEVRRLPVTSKTFIVWSQI